MSEERNNEQPRSIVPTSEGHTDTVAAGAAHVIEGVSTLYTDTLTVVWELVAPAPLEVGEILNSQLGAREVRPHDSQRPSTVLSGIILPELSTSGVGSHVDGDETRVYIMNRYDVRGLPKVDLRLVNNSAHERTVRVHIFRTRPSVSTPSGA